MSDGKDEDKPKVHIETDPGNGSTHVEITMPAGSTDTSQQDSDSTSDASSEEKGKDDQSDEKSKDEKGLTIAGYTPKELLMAPIKPPSDNKR